MRAVSLVHAWLYSLRGFIVMTVSLAIAFSFAIGGPPTDREVRLTTIAVYRTADVVGDELQSAAIELCPDLPSEMRALCTPPVRTPSAAKPRPQVTPQPQPRPADVAAIEPTPLTQAEAQPPSQLLGEPAPAPHVQRTRRQQHAATHRPARQQRDTVRTPGRRATIQTPSRRAAPRAPVQAQAIERQALAVSAPAPQDEEIIAYPWTSSENYADEDEQRQSWRERRRERRRALYDRQRDQSEGTYESRDDEESAPLPQEDSEWRDAR